MPLPAASTWPTRGAVGAGEGAARVAEELVLDEVGEMTAQLTVTNGRRARAESAWTCRARTPLPVPVSPSRSTVASVAATRAATASASRSAALLVSKRERTPRERWRS